jgi:hypothetical protein
MRLTNEQYKNMYKNIWLEIAHNGLGRGDVKGGEVAYEAVRPLVLAEAIEILENSMGCYDQTDDPMGFTRMALTICRDKIRALTMSPVDPEVELYEAAMAVVNSQDYEGDKPLMRNLRAALKKAGGK